MLPNLGFSTSVSAASSGAAKPHAAPFVELLAQASAQLGRPVASREVLMIGDNYGKVVVLGCCTRMLY